MSADDLLDIVDENDRVIGRARRGEVHGNPSLLHRVVHVLVFDGRGRLFLQKRTEDREVQPGKWDTSVGGHVDAGESPADAARRELAEELGIPPPGAAAPPLTFLHRYIHKNDWESELVSTWMVRWDGPVVLQESEISDGRFQDPLGIDLQAENSLACTYTPNFLDEIDRWRRAGAPLPGQNPAHRVEIGEDGRAVP